MNDAAFYWPDGKRVAVAVLAMFEIWSEGKSPAYTVQTTPLKPGAIDHSNITWSYYGGNVGAWRLMRALDEFGMRGTFCTSTRAIELFPETVTGIVRGGHDIAAHGVTQDQLLAYLSPEEERATIRGCLDAFERHTNKRPDGWVSPVLAWTPHTVDFLAQEGLRWYGDLNYVDAPRFLATPHGPVVGIPVTEFSDLRVLRSNPRDLFDFYKDTFDYLHEREPDSLLVFVMHCHWGGRPPIVAVFRQILKYFAQFPDVWLTNHGEIARWMNELGTESGSYAERYFAQLGLPAKPRAGG